MSDVSGDLEVGRGLTIPAGELHWRFSRSSGPGGQSVNTSDSRAVVVWAPERSRVLSEDQRERIMQRLAGRLVGGAVVVTAAEHRSQWQNRRAARQRLAELIALALAPPPRRRRRTRPSRSSAEVRLTSKRHRADTKRNRARPGSDD